MQKIKLQHESKLNQHNDNRNNIINYHKEEIMNMEQVHEKEVQMLTTKLENDIAEEELLRTNALNKVKTMEANLDANEKINTHLNIQIQVLQKEIEQLKRQHDDELSQHTLNVQTLNQKIATIISSKDSQ